MRRSTTNWPALLEEFASSGCSQKEFCSKKGLSLSTFCYWMKKTKKARAEGSETSPRFVQLDVVPDLAHRLVNGYDGELVVQLPLGVSLRFRGVGR